MRSLAKVGLVALGFTTLAAVGCGSPPSMDSSDAAAASDATVEDSGDASVALEASTAVDASDAATELTGCPTTMPAFCCALGGGGCPITWGTITRCASDDSGTTAGVGFAYYTPCDGFLAGAVRRYSSMLLYDAKTGSLVAALESQGTGGGMRCVAGPADFSISEACVALWNGGVGESEECDPDAGAPDYYCAGGSDAGAWDGG
jgi:hypothetical protein